jgi:hypothetical protein
MESLKTTFANKYAERHSSERYYDDYKRHHLIKDTTCDCPCPSHLRLAHKHTNISKQLRK